MNDYSLEGMEKLVEMVEHNNFNEEQKELLRQLVLDEFDRCMSCNPSPTESDCPYRIAKDFGTHVSNWKTKCYKLQQTYTREPYDYEKEEYLEDCPYLKLRNRIK